MKSAPTSTSPQELLKTVFGYDSFKPLQREIIQNVLDRRDTMVIMPTGGGKSLCYQIPGLILPGLTVVVSPLISLMKDQVEQLQALGVPAIFVNSSLAWEDYQQNLERVRRGSVKLLYVAPETLLTPRLLALLSEVELSCLTIDEAHCISEWGHDFRPEYRQIVQVRQRFPSAVCMALTATATTRVRQDIKSTLSFQSSNEFVASFNRENLFLEIEAKSDAIAQTLSFLHQHPDQSGIIYCFSRRGVDELSGYLNAKGFSVLPYHAGLSDVERRENQEKFIRDDVQIIVATIAFGMGINKPNVRFVIHYDLPKSIESYYQEIGRAGRDGLRADCLLLFSYADISKLNYFIDMKEEPERSVARKHLQALLGFADTSVCRRKPLLAYFGETYAIDNCGMCDNCLAGEQHLEDLTVPAQKFLSCVKRTGELFGAGHVADVLLGKSTAKVQKFAHQNLSTFGIGKDYTKKQWMHLARQFLVQGLLVQDGQYGSLKLTSKAFDVFKGQSRVLGRLQQERPSVASTLANLDYDAVLFELLRQKRKELADAGPVPPYVIFSDRTLLEMATHFPQSERSLSQMNGVGAVKLEKYGPIFLDLIRAYCQENGRMEEPKPPAQTSRAEQEPRHIEVGEAYNEGDTISNLAETWGVKLGTILDHLYKFQQEGQPLRSGEFRELCSLSPDLQERALEAFARLGTIALKPVFDALNGEVSYDDLRLLRLHFVSQQFQS